MGPSHLTCLPVTSKSYAFTLNDLSCNFVPSCSVAKRTIIAGEVNYGNEQD